MVTTSISLGRLGICRKKTEGRDRKKELLGTLLLCFLLVPMDLAHVLLEQPLLVARNLVGAEGKTKHMQYCSHLLPLV